MKIRAGIKADLPRVLELIKELAEYEKAPEEVDNTLEMMEEDGFGKNPIFEFYVAEHNDQIQGISLYYYRYSTWKGKRMYLEDIIVTESARGQGLGKALFEATMEKALADGCQGMSWQVLEWNEPAINFYQKYNASFDGEWLNCSLSFEQINEYLIKNK